MAAKVEPTGRQSVGAAGDSDDALSQQLRAIAGDLQRAGLQPNHPEEDEPVERDDLPPGITSNLEHENKMKKRGSRGFVRFLLAICIGVAGTLAWQSYGGATKQIIATRAPELGWSPDTKQMIANSIQWLGWTKTPPAPETTAAETVAPKAPKAPTAPSLDPAQVQQMAQNLVALREMVQQLTAGQDQTTREIAKLESAVGEILTKIPEPPPQPPAAPARKPVPVPPSSREPTAPQSSRTPIPPH